MVKIAIVGAGGIANRHTEAISAIDDAGIVAVVYDLQPTPVYALSESQKNITFTQSPFFEADFVLYPFPFSVVSSFQNLRYNLSTGTPYCSWYTESIPIHANPPFFRVSSSLSTTIM
jgi:hypothetical protein